MSSQPRSSLVTQMIKNLPAMQEIQGQSLGQEDTMAKGILPGEVHGQRSLVDYNPRGRKEFNKTEQLTLTQPWKGTKHNFTQQRADTESLSPGSLHKPLDQPHLRRGRHHRQEVLWSHSLGNRDHKQLKLDETINQRNTVQMKEQDKNPQQ